MNSHTSPSQHSPSAAPNAATKTGVAGSYDRPGAGAMGPDAMGGPLALWPLQTIPAALAGPRHPAVSPHRVIDSDSDPVAIQRAPEGPQSSTTAPTPAAPSPSSAPTHTTQSANTVIINDDQTAVPGQMRRSEFMGALRSAITAVCDAELAEVGRDTAGCPYLSTTLAAYEGRPAAEVERLVRQYANPGDSTAAGFIGAAVSRVRAAVRIWKVTGLITGVPDGGGTPADLVPVQSKGETTAGVGSASAMHPGAIRQSLGAGASLEPGLRTDMERQFGARFSGVRVHTDSTAGALSKQHSAKAFTVGNHVAFAQGQYRPDTLQGKLLIAHELAHTVQQSSGQVHTGISPVDESRLEQAADVASVAAVTGDSWATSGTFQQAGLRFQGCSDKEKSKPLLEQLRNETDAYTLATTLGRITDAELSELAGKAPSGSELTRAIQWEQAWRGRQWARLGTLARSRGQGFVEVYIDRVVDAIAAGGLGIRIDASDPGFAAWAKGQLRDLGRGPTGFRLIVELLATGQSVEIKGTTGGHETERIMPDSDPDAGRLVTTGPDGKPLPPGQQRRGAPTGSRITFNPTLGDNQTTVGLGPDGRPALIHSDPTVTFGHELIHALHNARGENVAPPPGLGVITRAMGQPNFLVRNPITGRTENPEELGTITGDKSFGAPVEATGTPNWATSFNVTTDITENALRAERGLEQRISHHGGTTLATQTARAGETLDQIANRYYLPGGQPVPTALRAGIRAAIVAMYPPLATRPWPEGVALQLPHGEYIALHVTYVQNGANDMAELANKLLIR